MPTLKNQEILSISYAFYMPGGIYILQLKEVTGYSLLGIKADIPLAGIFNPQCLSPNKLIK